MQVAGKIIESWTSEYFLARGHRIRKYVCRAKEAVAMGGSLSNNDRHTHIYMLLVTLFHMLVTRTSRRACGIAVRQASMSTMSVPFACVSYVHSDTGVSFFAFKHNSRTTTEQRTIRKSIRTLMTMSKNDA
eukprot:scaffold87510_cov47-Attheya_sp.AAC.5